MKHGIQNLFIFILLLMALPSRGQTTLDSAVNFSAKDIHGNTHVLYDILDNGNMVVIDFFSTSCGPCATYAPMIQESFQHFGMNNGNVFFLGISWGDDNLGVHLFDSIHGITYPSVSGTQGSGNQINIAYNVLSYPSVVLIMPDRSIQEKQIWPPTTSRIDSILIANGGITTRLISQSGSAQWHKLWPNPARDQVKISLSLNAPSRIRAEMIDLTGKMVSSAQQDLQAGLQFIQLDFPDIPPGIYVVRLEENGLPIGTKRLIVY